MVLGSHLGPCGLDLKSQSLVIESFSVGSRAVLSGILAGGIPGFRMVLCCFTHSLVWPGGLGVVCVFCCFAIPI